MKKANWLLVLVALLAVVGCASILPTTETSVRISDSSGQNILITHGFTTEYGADNLLRSTAQADRTMRLGEAQAEVIKSQAELNRTMARIIEKNPNYLWYGFGLGLYGARIQWSDFQQNIYYPEALIDWQNQTMPQRKERK